MVAPRNHWIRSSNAHCRKAGHVKVFCAQLDLHAFSPNDSKMVVPAELVHYLARLEPQSFSNLSDAEESAKHNNPRCIVSSISEVGKIDEDSTATQRFMGAVIFILSQL